jgi:hypothetical protein
MCMKPPDIEMSGQKWMTQGQELLREAALVAKKD